MATNDALREQFEYWQQGRLLETQGTRKWSEETKRAGDYEERCMVFKHFSAEDQGRGREFVAHCRTPEQAKALVDEHNAVVTALSSLPTMSESELQNLISANWHTGFRKKWNVPRLAQALIARFPHLVRKS